jgi:hypothetical protein
MLRRCASSDLTLTNAIDWRGDHGVHGHSESSVHGFAHVLFRLQLRGYSLSIVLFQMVWHSTFD